MKQLAAALLALLCAALCGCNALIPAQYTQIQPHTAAQSAAADADVPTVRNYTELRRAIAGFAENGVAHGVIRTANYTGSVTDDLPRAAYAVSREDPIGNYAIDYITHDCSLIVSYYEITIDITFRDMAEDPRTLDYVTSRREVETLLRGAMDNYRDHVTWYAISSFETDYDALAQEIYDSDPLQYIAIPDISAANYPEQGRSRIVELTLGWPADAASLKKMERAAEESLQAAEVYVRYRDTAWDKLRLLYTYLTERFSYEEQATSTPLYSALCEGLITDESAAVLWQLLCARLGVDCQTVSGSRDGSAYHWNIVTLDGLSYHVDLLRDLLADDALHLRYDEEMTGYSWDASLYPACPKPEPIAEIPEENAETDVPASAVDTQFPDDAQEAEPSAEKEEKTEANSLRRS